MFYHFRHRYDSRCLKSVFFFNLSQRALLSLSPLHTVYGNDQARDGYVSLCLDDRQRLLNRGSGSRHVFNDYNLVSIGNGTSKKDSFVAMVLDLFPVGALLDILVIELADRHRRRHRQRNPLIGRPKQHVKVKAELAFYRFGIVLT